MGRHIHLHIHRTRDAAKLSKAAVDYSRSTGADCCKKCSHFVAPHSCAIVDGIIDPEYWCRRFLAKRASDESRETKERNEGKLSERKREEVGRVGSEQREEMPASAFLEPGSRKYPVKAKHDGEWKYDRALLLAAAREARMHGHEELARRADAIREREFGSAARGARRR